VSRVYPYFAACRQSLIDLADECNGDYYSNYEQDLVPIADNIADTVRGSSPELNFLLQYG